MLRWGILGAGGIARKFAESLNYTSSGSLYGVGSRSLEKAKAFGADFGAEVCYGSYEELVADPNVDAVYVATPHPFHRENTLLALNHSKAVLCEKPLAVNCAEAREMVDLAREKGCFLMEAFWTRFIPAPREARRLIQEGAIGSVKSCWLSFVMENDGNPQGRLLNPALAGGALLDIGVYPINISQWMLGKIALEEQRVKLGPTGVDVEADLHVSFEKGGRGQLHFDLDTPFSAKALFEGTQGTLELADPFFFSQQVILEKEGTREVLDFPFEGPGYHFEADHVAWCLEQGLTQSPEMPWEESLQLMGFTEELRKKWGLVYPFEK